ncbi:AraC family transcriptional regulator [Streptomyces olivoreticuli]
MTNIVERPKADESDTRSDGATLFQGGDIAELYALVSSEFAPHRFRVTGRRQASDAQFRRIWRRGISVYELGYGRDVAVVPGELPDFYHVHIPVAGTGVVTVDGEELDSPLSVVGPGQHLAMSWSDDSLTRILHISRRSMEQALAVRLGDLPNEIVRFSSALHEKADPVQAWLAIAQTYAQAAETGLLTRSPLALGHFEQLLIHGLLDTQPNTLARSLREGSTMPSAAIRRATAFCAEHAHEAISVADIAHAAKVGVRALRMGFRTHLSTTPLSYLRRIRLERAHHDLLAIAHGEVSGNVTSVALRWGFTHLSRFAEAHRRVYGMTPSQVLHEAAPGAIRKASPATVVSG